MKRLILITLLALMFTIPSMASAFDLDVVPYIQINPVMIKMDNDTRPLGAVGVRMEAKNIYKNLEFYVAFEGGKIDSPNASPASSEEIWERCQFGCPPDAMWNKWKDSSNYLSVITGIQYRFDIWSSK